MKKKQITIPIFMPQAGCPGRCIFCNQRVSSNSKKNLNLNEIKKKIEDYLVKVSPQVELIEIAFFGGNFTGLPLVQQEKYLSLANTYKKQGKVHRIRLSTRPDYIDDEKINLLHKFKVDTIELGVQSFSDKILANINRLHNARDIFQAVELCKKYEFNFILQLMAGLPGDTRAGSIESARIAARVNPGGVRIFPTIVLENTVLEKLYNENLYDPLTLDEATQICKDMFAIFEEKKIPVIRVGLHPFGDEKIVAGPFHPSFGFLVKARLRRDEMETRMSALLSEGRDYGKLTIKLPHNGKEEYIGYKRENVQYIQDKFGDIGIDFSVNEDISEFAITTESCVQK